MISRTSLHAIRAIIVLAQLPPASYAGTANLAQAIGAPPNYLGKLLQQLTRSGLVKSQKGLGGGFRLGRPASEISLFHVVEPLEHISRWEGCILGRPSCDHTNPCALHHRWKVVRDAYLKLLHETTIASLQSADAEALAQMLDTSLAAVPTTP